jgi:hypothetical protein
MFDLSNLPPATRAQITASPRWTAFFQRAPETLLSVDTNAKTVKGQKLGYHTAILYLTPAKGSGANLCSMAELAQCDAPCLATAGRGAMSNVQMARLRKTLYFLQYREQFMAQLVKEVSRLSLRYGPSLLVRLNGTSDIRWELVSVNRGGGWQGTDNRSIMHAFPEVQFYDYTKIPNRHQIPNNYDLTYSYSGVVNFYKHVEQAKASGMRVAVVFSNRDRIPKSFDGMQCVDGDDTDIRHLDPQGVAVALYAKGRAKQDRSGFVVQV